MAADMVRAKRASPRGARACVRECAHVCTSIIREIKHPFQDNVISLISYTLYICRIA